MGKIVCLKVIKRVKNYHENGSLGMDALAKHVEKDDSAKCGLIDSMGRKQKTIIINDRDHVETEDKLEERIVTSGQWRRIVIINDRGHVNKDDKGSTLIRGSAFAMRCYQNTPQVRCVLALKQKREALGPPFSFKLDKQALSCCSLNHDLEHSF